MKSKLNILFSLLMLVAFSFSLAAQEGELITDSLVIESVNDSLLRVTSYQVFKLDDGTNFTQRGESVAMDSTTMENFLLRLEERGGFIGPVKYNGQLTISRRTQAYMESKSIDQTTSQVAALVEVLAGEPLRRLKTRYDRELMGTYTLTIRSDTGDVVTDVELIRRPNGNPVITDGVSQSVIEIHDASSISIRNISTITSLVRLTRIREGVRAYVSADRDVILRPRNERKN